MGLLRRVATLSSWTLVSRMLGLWRDRLLGAAFGAGSLLDAFMLAFALPNLFRNLFGEGALSAAFVPRYVRMRSSEGEAAEDFAGVVLTRLFILLSAIAALGMVAAGIVLLYAEPRLALVAGLALPQLPYLIFICMIALMAGMLNGRGHFAVPAAAPVLLNCCLIATVLIFEDVWFLPWAVLLTGLLQCIVHIIALVRTGGMPRPGLKGSEQLNDLNKAFAPTLFASSIYQLNTLADSLIAYLLLADAPGAVTVLYFANRLLQFPLALIGHGIGTAIYPDLAQAGERGWEAVGDTLRRASGLLVGLLLPAGVGLALVADPLVRTIYQTGAFDAQAAERVVVVTGIYACQVLPVALSKLVLRGFHAGLDQRTPFIIGLITVGSNLALNLWLVQTPLEEAGLAVASLLSSLIAVFVSMVALARRGGGAAFSARGTIHPLLATVVMGLAVWAFLQAWPVAGAASGGAHAIRLLLAVGVGLATFAAVMGPGLKTLLRSTRG